MTPFKLNSLAGALSEQIKAISRYILTFTFLAVAASATAREDFDDSKGTTEIKPSAMRISIVNNQIIVPVKLWNNGRIVTARMILDTGASVTTIYSRLASELNLGKNKLSSVRTTSANGTTTDALLTKVDMIELDGKLQSNADVIIMPARSEMGADGLLGHSFLRLHKFTIDYDNRLLRWD